MVARFRIAIGAGAIRSWYGDLVELGSGDAAALSPAAERSRMCRMRLTP
jgi:hypothetical protein